MASQFQSRLVGTIVLVALGVIVLPDIFDGKKAHYQEEMASIPIKPERDSDAEIFEVLEPQGDEVNLPDPAVMEVQRDAGSIPSIGTVEMANHSTTEGASAAQPEQEQVEVVARDIPEKNAYADSAWIIQLMALKNADNAQVLVNDLQKRGYQAHILREKNFTRVVIGPDVSKSKLERQAIELEKITGSKGQLLKFKPLNP